MYKPDFGSWGLLVLYPRKKRSIFIKKHFKRMITPPIVALFIGLMAGLFNAKAYSKLLLDVLSKSSSAWACCHALAGFVIGGMVRACFLIKVPGCNFAFNSPACYNRTNLKC